MKKNPGTWRAVWVLAVSAALLLGACEAGSNTSWGENALHELDRQHAPSNSEMRVHAAPAAAMMKSTATTVQEEQVSQDDASSTLAYEHTIYVEVEPSKILSSQQALIDNCASRKDCTLLRASQQQDARYGRAGLELRASATSVAEMMELAQAQGRLKHKNTQAEDLAFPLRDSARRLGMLRDYRQQLEALRKSKAQSVSDLIEITRELASVQSQIEDVSGTRAHMLQRVQTQRLEVVFEVAGQDNAASGWSKLRQAVRNFGDNLLAGFAWGIEAIGWALPVLVLAVLGLAAVRWMWLRWRRKRQATRSGAST